MERVEGGRGRVHEVTSYISDKPVTMYLRVPHIKQVPPPPPIHTPWKIRFSKGCGYGVWLRETSLSQVL